jgi:hypothetical protein
MNAAPTPRATADSDVAARVPDAPHTPHTPEQESRAADREAAQGAARAAALQTAGFRTASPAAQAPPHRLPEAAGPARPPRAGGTRHPVRKGPPGRRDPRRPGTARRSAAPSLPSASALRAAAARERERQPPYWFASRLVLVLSGQRPVHTLLQYTRAAAYEELTCLASRAPLRPRGADRTSPEVLDARGSQPCDGVIEAFARIVTGGRQRAIAFRLELCDDHRWRCAAVELDGHSAGRVRS